MNIISQLSEHFIYLKQLTEAVIQASRILPGANLADQSPGEQLAKNGAPLVNETGIVLIRPGGLHNYPSFWIRDFAMSLESGLIDTEELRQMMLLTASRQNGSEEVILDEARVPPFAVPDHINLDGQPVFFPGTYSSGTDQGGGIWGMYPPYCDHYYFIEMVYVYVQQSGDLLILEQMINGYTLRDRIQAAYEVASQDPANGIVWTDAEARAVNFGFVDSVIQTGFLLFSTILKYRATRMLIELYEEASSTTMAERLAALREQKLLLEAHVPRVFQSEDGWLKASTGISGQADVWGTCYAIYAGLLQGEARQAALEVIRDSYLRGTTSYRGNVRHVPTTEDFSEESCWESSWITKNTYQNGAYWGTPAGWYAYALNEVDPALGEQFLDEYIRELQEGDYRITEGEGSPWECFHPDRGHYQGPVYLTSVAVPYAAMKRMMGS